MEPCMLEVLQKAFDDGILDLSQLQESIAMKKRKDMLEKHPYSLWEGKNNIRIQGISLLYLLMLSYISGP